MRKKNDSPVYAFDLTRLNSFQCSRTPSFSIKFGFAAGESTKQRGYFFSKAGCSFDVFEDFAVSNPVLFAAFSACCFHALKIIFYVPVFTSQSFSRIFQILQDRLHLCIQ